MTVRQILRKPVVATYFGSAKFPAYCRRGDRSPCPPTPVRSSTSPRGGFCMTTIESVTDEVQDDVEAQSDSLETAEAPAEDAVAEDTTEAPAEEAVAEDTTEAVAEESTEVVAEVAVAEDSTEDA